jgi:hypothetical protein
MNLIQFVTLLVAGVVNIACLVVSFVGLSSDYLQLIQQIGEGVTIIAVAIISFKHITKK